MEKSNSAASGAPVPIGHYSYFIKAQNNAGVRQPPTNGDGIIEVLWLSPSASMQPNPFDPVSYGLTRSLAIILLTLGAAGMGLYILLRQRKKSVTVYLPENSSSALEEMRQSYPEAVVGDYVTTSAEGSMQRYKGVTIHRPKNGEVNENEWLTAIADRAKEMAGIDSISVDYHGKTRIL